MIDDVGQRTGKDPVQPRSQQGIDHEIGRSQLRAKSPLADERGDELALPGGHILKCQKGVAAEPFRVLQQRDFDGISSLFQQPRGDKAISAVVPRAAENQNARAFGRHFGRCIRDMPAGIFHKRTTGYTGGNRQPIRLSHLNRRQQLGKIDRSHIGQGGKLSVFTSSQEGTNLMTGTLDNRSRPLATVKTPGFEIRHLYGDGAFIACTVTSTQKCGLEHLLGILITFYAYSQCGAGLKSKRTTKFARFFGDFRSGTLLNSKGRKLAHIVL